MIDGLTANYQYLTSVLFGIILFLLFCDIQSASLFYYKVCYDTKTFYQGILPVESFKTWKIYAD